MALFSALHTKVALYAVIRIWSTAFGLDPAWGRVILVVALVTILWGAIASAAPFDAREILAWQMVSGVGVILTALVRSEERRVGKEWRTRMTRGWEKMKE